MAVKSVSASECKEHQNGIISTFGHYMLCKTVNQTPGKSCNDEEGVHAAAAAAAAAALGPEHEAHTSDGAYRDNIHPCPYPCPCPRRHDVHSHFAVRGIPWL
jgi:hypothetical protein